MFSNALTPFGPASVLLFARLLSLLGASDDPLAPDLSVSSSRDRLTAVDVEMVLEIEWLDEVDLLGV